MNQKKAKTLRRVLKAAGIDPTHKEYHAINVSPFSPAGTILLAETCGRYKYKQMKGM